MLDAENTENTDTTAEAAPAPEVAAPAAKKVAKKAAKKAPAKKAAKAAKAVEPTAAEGEAPAADAESAPAAPRRRATKKAAAKPAAAAPVDTAEGSDATEPVAITAAAPMVLFQAPEKAPAPARKRATKKSAPAEPAAEAELPLVEDETETGTEGGPEGDAPARPAKKAAKKAQPRRTAAKTAAAEDEKPETEPDAAETESDEADEPGEGEPGEGGARRRRRRGGRRRRRGAGEGAEAEGDEPDEGTTAGDDDDQDGDATSRRRRTRVRQPRNPEDEITSIGGSTRLEAKKQRRREGREAGRRRAPIVSEAEFLARREAVDRVMVIRQRDDLTQIAVLEDKVLVEHYASRESQTSLIGNIYLGRVQNVLPSMEAAFIDIGKGRNAVLYAGEVNWSALGHKDGQPRKVESVLKSGQTILVQVSKDPVGHKGARLTGQISLPGRFLVYVPDGNTSGISRKLPDTERNRLKALLKEIVPDTAGVIVRTAAEGASEEELTQDVERLTARWAEIEKAVAAGRSPELLYGEPDMTLKVVRDLFTEDFNSLVIEGDEAWDLVDGYVTQVAPDLRDRLKRFESTDGRDVFAAHRIDEQIAKGLDRKVWLPSGGSLVIDRTEAMTVVDVNTGKFTGSGGNLEETVTKNNLEAAEEMVRQLRLRDIGGIIVIDFIDMVLESNRDLVLRRLVECLGRDRTRHQVAEVTSLGLVQMTRKRIGSGLIETFSEDCDHCKGRGIIVHEQPIEPSNRSVGMGGGMGGGSGSGSADEPRGRRNRGGRNRGRGGSDEAAAQPEAAKPSPMALAGTKPHPESEVVELDPMTGTDEPVTPQIDEVVEVVVEPVVEDSVEDVAAPKGEVRADQPDLTVEQAPEEAEPAPAPVTVPIVVTSTRRRRAGRPAGPAVVVETPVESAEPVTDEATEDAEEGAEGAEGDSPSVFHVPVKKKGSRKR